MTVPYSQAVSVGYSGFVLAGSSGQGIAGNMRCACWEKKINRSYLPKLLVLI